MTLNEFLVKAKTNTYARNGEGEEKILEDGGKELVYAEGVWGYRDRYFGFNPFIGEEIVWKNEKAYWAMNYYGLILSNKVAAQNVYEFLKKSLKQVVSDRPFRGPTELTEGDWMYRDESSGEVDNFQGKEAVYYQGDRVYELKYHGGRVKVKNDRNST